MVLLRSAGHKVIVSSSYTLFVPLIHKAVKRRLMESGDEVAVEMLEKIERNDKRVQTLNKNGAPVVVIS